MAVTFLDPGKALKLWHRTTLACVQADGPDLNQRQLAMLLVIYLEAPPHGVRQLADRLRVTKPVITRALDHLGKLGFVDRRRDPTDRRNVIISRTVAGARFLDEFADLASRQWREID